MTQLREKAEAALAEAEHDLAEAEGAGRWRAAKAYRWHRDALRDWIRRNVP